MPSLGFPHRSGCRSICPLTANVLRNASHRYFVTTTPSTTASASMAMPGSHNHSTEVLSSPAVGPTPSVSPTDGSAAASKTATATSLRTQERASDIRQTSGAPQSSSNSCSRSNNGSSGTATNTTTSKDIQREIAGRLRRALKALTEAEQAKAAKLAQRSVESAGTDGTKASLNPTPTSTVVSSAVDTAGSSAPIATTSTTVNSTADGALAARQAPPKTAPSVAPTLPLHATTTITATTVRPLASLPQPTSASVATRVGEPAGQQPWIRNKRRKFWALVNDGAPENAMINATTTASNRRTSTVGLAAAPTPLISTAPSARTSTSPSPSITTTSLSAPAAEEIATSVLRSSNCSGSSSSSGSGGPADVGQEAAALSSPDTTVTSSTRRKGPPTMAPPFRNRYKTDVARILSELLSSDPSMGPQLLEQLSPESRRLLFIMGTASEYFGGTYGDVAEQVKEADTDRDNSISSKEFDAWVSRTSSTKKRKYTIATNRSAPPSPVAAAGAKDGKEVQSSSPTCKGTSSWGGTAGAGERQLMTSPVGSDLHDTPKTDLSADRLNSSNASASSRNSSSSSNDSVGGLPLPPTPSEGCRGSTASIRSPDLPTAAVQSRNRIIETMQRNIDATPLRGDGGGAAAMSSGSKGATSTVTERHRGSTASAAVASKSWWRQRITRCDGPTPPGYIPWRLYVRLVVVAAAPFLAFGMLDNSTLVLAGGAIDGALSESLGLTEMAAASLGGVVSGVAGIQVHGLAERWTRAAPPSLSPNQARSATAARASRFGSTLGMVVGLILGMTPLLFMHGQGSTDDQVKAEHEKFRKEAEKSRQRRRHETAPHGAEQKELEGNDTAV